MRRTFHASRGEEMLQDETQNGMPASRRPDHVGDSNNQASSENSWSASASAMSLKATRIDSDLQHTPRNDVKLILAHDSKQLRQFESLRPTIRGGLVVLSAAFEQNWENILQGLTRWVSGQQCHLERTTLWVCASPHALQVLPLFFIHEKKWSECKRVICSISYTAESIRMLGAGATQDTFATLVVAGHYYEDCDEDLANVFDEFRTFVKECRSLSPEQRDFGCILRLAEQSNQASVKAVAREVISKLKEAIALAEEQPQVPQDCAEERSTSSSNWQSAIRCLELADAINAAICLSRPWKARLYAALTKAAGWNQSESSRLSDLVSGSLPWNGDAFESACQQLYWQSHATINGAYVNEQHSLATQALSMILKRHTLIRIVGAPGSGKTAVLSMIIRGLQDVKEAGMSVVRFQKMRWHSAHALCRYLAQEILGIEHDDQETTLLEAVHRADRTRCFVLVLDGLTRQEIALVESATSKAPDKQKFVVVVSCDEAQDAQVARDALAIPPLDKEDRKELARRRADSVRLLLSEAEIDELVDKEGAGSPQYLVFALGSLSLQRSEEEKSRVADLPTTMEHLLTDENAGVLASLEAAFGVPVVRSITFWFSLVSSDLRLEDLRLLLAFQVSALPDPFWSDFEKAILPFVKRFGSLTCMPSPLVKAARQRYGWEHDSECFSSPVISYHALHQHLKFETEFPMVQALVRQCKQVDAADPEVKRAAGWLEAAAMLPHAPDMDMLQKLVGACGLLSGSPDLDDAKLKLEVRDILRKERDIGQISTLCAAYESILQQEDADVAKRRLVCERRLGQELDIWKMTALVQHLEGFTGPNLDHSRKMLHVVELLPGATSLEVLRERFTVCGTVTGSDIVAEARMLLELEDTLATERDVGRLAGLTNHYNKIRAAKFPLIDKSTRLQRAEEILAAEAELCERETDITRLRVLVRTCEGITGSTAVDRASCALEAEAELASQKNSSVIKELLNRCSFLTGSAVVDHKKTVMECEKRLRTWIPFTLIQSLAKRLKETMGRGDVRSRIQVLFAEIDADNSGYISRSEMEVAMERLGVQISHAEMDNVMQGITSDGTGEIDQLEFIAFVESLIAKTDAVSSQDEELEEIGRLIECIKDDLEGSDVVEDARFKILLNEALRIRDLSWLSNFFAANQEKLDRCRLTSPELEEKRKWVEAEKELTRMLRNIAHVVRPTLPKRELWLAVQKCGELENSTSLLRARRIMDTEKALMFENVAAKIRELLKLCGVLTGTPSAQRARRLLSAELSLEHAIAGAQCSTVESIKHGIQQCYPLEGSEVLDEARVAVACEVVLEIETRSAAIRRVTPLCKCVRGSKVVDRCRKMIQLEDSISEVADSNLAKYESNPSDIGITVTEALGEDVYSLLMRQASAFHLHQLQLSKEVTDADVLRQKIALCGTELSDSAVLDGAREVIAALEALPWTDALDEMSHVRDAIIKQVGSKYLNPERQSARLRQIFHEFDDDGSGSIDRDELDKAFMQLGVHINSWELQTLIQTYDVDGTGEIEFDEFEKMVELMLRGSKWHNCTDILKVRENTSICGYLKAGRQTEWLFMAQGWLKAEENLSKGVSDHNKLVATVDACGPLTGSAAIEQAVLVLQAACEMQFAVTHDQFHQLMAVCGHLQGLEVLDQKRGWLEAEAELIKLNYHLEGSEWKPSSHVMLWQTAERCGGLIASPALSNAMAALQAETDLGRTQECAEIHRLLGVCGHLTGSSTIDERRSWIDAEARLQTAVELKQIKELCALCSVLKGSAVVATSLQLLEAESRLANACTEELLRDGLSQLDGKLTASDNVREAILRYQKFALRRHALDRMHLTTDSWELTDCLQSLLLCELFDSLDLNGIGHLTFKDIRNALHRLGIQPQVEAIGAATALFDGPDTTALSIFLHLTLGNVGREMASLVDAAVIVEAMHSMQIVPRAVLVEQVMALLHAGEPDFFIYFESFKEFMCAQMEQVGFDVKTLRNKVDFKLPAELEEKVKWIDAELQLAHCSHYPTLLHTIDKCGSLTGSTALDNARDIVQAAKVVSTEPDIEKVKVLLSRCRHLEACESVAEAKGLVVMEQWLSEATDRAAIKFYLHACNHLSSPAITAAKELMLLHDSLIEHVLGRRRERVVELLAELNQRLTTKSDLMKLATCWTALASVLATEKDGNPDPALLSTLMETLMPDFGISLQDYRCAVSARLQSIVAAKQPFPLAQSEKFALLYLPLHHLEDLLMQRCMLMKGSRPSAQMQQSVLDQTLLLNQWRLMLNPFLSGECKDANPRILSSYLTLCINSRSWSRCAGLVCNLFYLRFRIFHAGISAVITDLSGLLRAAENFRQIHPTTMRKLYAAVWFCESRRKELASHDRLLPLALQTVGMHPSCHDSKSTFSSAHYAQEGSGQKVQSERQSEVGSEMSQPMLNWEDFMSGRARVDQLSQTEMETGTDPSYAPLTVNGYGELFSLTNLESEIRQVAQNLLEKAKNAITDVELLSSSFRPEAVLTGKKAVLKARNTVQGRDFLRVVCLLGLGEALPDKNWVRRLECALENDAVNEPLKLHANAAQVDEHMDNLLDAVSSDIVNWEMGEVFLQLSDIWQSWIRSRWHRACFLINVQNDASTRMGRRWVENVLVGALAGCSTLPRGSFEVEPLSDEAVLVEITNRHDIRTDVAALQQMILDPSSEFHKACDRPATLAHQPGVWRHIKLAIWDPCDSEEEVAFLTRFVLPALTAKCQREGLKVTLDWQVVSRETLAGEDGCWDAQPLPRDCFVGGPPEEDGIGLPFFVVLPGSIEDCDPENIDAVPVVHLCKTCCDGRKKTEGLVAVCTAEGEHRSSKHHGTSHKDKKQRAVESAYRVLQASQGEVSSPDSSSTAGSPDLFGRATSTHNAKLRNILRAGIFKKRASRSRSASPEPDRTGDSRAVSESLSSSGMSPISPFPGELPRSPGQAHATHRRLASPLSTVRLAREMRDSSPPSSSASSVTRSLPNSPAAAAAPAKVSQPKVADLRSNLKQMKEIRFCEYPPNFQRSIERNVIKARDGMLVDTVCRLADFGLLMMDRLWNTIQAHCGPVEKERNAHSIEGIAHERQLRENIAHVMFNSTGSQKAVYTEAMSRIRERQPVVRIAGAPGSGKSAILSTLAADMKAGIGTEENVVVFCNKPWHESAEVLRYVCHEILGISQDVEGVSFRQAFGCIPADQRFTFIFDGLTASQREEIASAAALEGAGKQTLVVVFSCDSIDSAGFSETICIPPLSPDERRQLVQRRSGAMGLSLLEEEVEALIEKDDAGLPLYLVAALGSLAIQEVDTSAEQLPGSIASLLENDSVGVLSALERLHGGDLVATFFRWFVVFRNGLAVSDLTALLREDAQCSPMQMPHRSETLRPVPKGVLDALFRDAVFFMSVTTGSSDSQTTAYLSNPALLRAVCARYGCVAPTTSVELDVAIHCDKQLAKETDLRTLMTMFDIVPEFGSNATKRKALAWIEAEKRLAHVSNYNALKAAVAACGKLSGSTELLKAQQAFEAVRKLAYERDIEKVRTLCHNYRIKQSHPNVEYARDILMTEAEMVMERRIEVLRKLYQKCQRYHGSATISKVCRILESEEQLAHIRSFFDLRRCLSICAGIVDSVNVENAKAVISAVEHLTLKKQLPKVHFDALIERVPESKELISRYWIVHPRVRPPAMIWNEDTTNTLRRHLNKLRNAATEVQVDPASILEEFWHAFDEIVTKLSIARDRLEQEEGTVINLEEDHNSIIQDALQRCHFLTDVPIIKIMMRRRQAAQDLANERRIAAVQEKLEICGMIRSNRTVDAAKDALKSEKVLLTERHVPTIKKLMDKCQWLQNSEAVVWAADVLDRIEQMRPFMYTTAAVVVDAASLTEPGPSESAEEGHIPANDLKEFLDVCCSLTGSDVIDRACQMASSIARLEQEKDSKRWSTLLAEQGWYERHPEEPASQTSWDVLEVAILLRVARPVRGDLVLTKARKYHASALELTRLITPHINVGIRQLNEVLKRCGPLCGLQTAIDTVAKIHNLHANLKAEEKLWLEQMLEAWRRPGENVEFVGWEKIVDMLPHILPSSALTEILAAASIERARRCVEALRLIESDNPPTAVPTLERLRAECSNLPMSNKLDYLRTALDTLNDLKRDKHTDAVKRAVELCVAYDSSATLSLARDQVVALEKIEKELRKGELVRLVATCEGLVGSATLDRDRKWLAADEILATERRVPEIRKELEKCGDLQDSRNMDTARKILEYLETMIETSDAVEVRRLVDYLNSENVTENPKLDKTRTVLWLESSLPDRVDTIDLVHALIQVDERLTNSTLSVEAHSRLHVLLATEWSTVCMHNTLPVLKKFHELGLEMVMKSGFNYSYLSGLHAEEGKDFMQAWTEVGARLLAVDNLKGETDFKTISSLLSVIGEIKECAIVDEARGWIESIHALEMETDAKMVQELVAKCGPVGGSDVLALAKQRVMTLAALEKGESSTFDIQTLREYCTLCEHLHGNPFLDKCRAAVAAVDKLKEYDRISYMHNFTKLWTALQQPDILSAGHQMFDLLNVLERNHEMKELREAAAPLRSLQGSDDIKASRKWLHILHVSNDLRNDTFTVVSKEPQHVTVSQQAEGMQSCLKLAEQVTGCDLLDMARAVQEFFAPNTAYREDFLRRVPAELREGLQSEQRGKQMEALLAALSSALANEHFLTACKALDAEDALRTERCLVRLPNLVKDCGDFTSPVIAEARDILTAEKQLGIEEEYNAIKELLAQCEGYTGSKTLDLARHKMALVDELEGCVDYFKIRDVVPHVKMSGSTALEDAQWINFLVREMMGTTKFARLQEILSQLRERRVVGFPEMDRVGELLELEGQIDGIKELDELAAALKRIGNRITDSEKIDKARSRHVQLANAIGEAKRCCDLPSAALYGNMMAMDYFLEQDPTALHARNDKGVTALHRACAGGAVPAVMLLLSHKASPDVVAKDGITPLHEAAAAGHEEVVRLLTPLIPQLVDATATVMRQTALHAASKGGHHQVVALLLDHGADIDLQDANGNSAILHALLGGHRETSKLLCKRRSNLRLENGDGYTCLHLAARQDYIGLVCKCVRLGLAVSARTRAGYCALHMAAMASASEVCAYLLRHGEDVNVRDGWGSTALHHASRAGSSQTIELLLMAGADPRIRNWEGRGLRALDVSPSREVNAMLYKGLYPKYSNLENPPMLEVDGELDLPVKLPELEVFGDEQSEEAELHPAEGDGEEQSEGTEYPVQPAPCTSE